MSNREQRRKEAKTAKQVMVEAWQVPVYLNRDETKHIGFVTLDPSKMPEGDFGLSPGTDKSGKIVAFATVSKEKSKLVK